MNKVEKLIEKCQSAKNETDEFWIKAYNEMQDIIKGEYPQNEKDKLLKLGVGETILMMYNGISTQK